MEPAHNVRWLQLSDLHIFYSTSWDLMRKSYSELAEVFHPDFIVVTGDYCHFTRNRSYKKALDFLTELAVIFSLEKKDFFFVPGNHDVRDYTWRTEIITTITANKDDPDFYQKYYNSGKKKSDLLNAFEAYDSFVREFYGNSVTDARVSSPSSVMCIPWCNRLNILMLNTALISSGAQERSEMLDIHGVSNLIGSVNTKLPTIVLAHHEINALVSSQKIMLERLLTMLNARVYLCGDKHKTELDYLNKYSITDNRIPCIVCGKSAPETGDNYSDVCIVGYNWKGRETQVAVFRWVNNEPTTPYQFIQSDKWVHSINKPFSFKMYDSDEIQEKPTVTDMVIDAWTDFVSVFEEQDRIIAKELNGTQIINKTNNREEFSAYKIVSSLIRIGVPFKATAIITKTAIDRLLLWNKFKSKTDLLTTKLVRDFVLDAIKDLDIKDWSQDNIGSWCSKYIHRYGHNNTIVQVINIPEKMSNGETVSDASYKFIQSVLLPDLFGSASPGFNYGTIPANQKKRMATEVISFINECDLYRIEYQTLKRFIFEIATQPPHPWLVDAEQRMKLIAYDKEAVLSNLEQIESYKNKGEKVPYTIVVELLHHSSAMILDKYFSFCGCDDLDSFMLLHQYFKRLISARLDFSKWDEILSDYALKSLYEGFKICKIDIVLFYENYLCEIRKCKTRGEELVEKLPLIQEFAQLSISLIEGLSESQQSMYFALERFTHVNWSQFNQKEQNDFIRRILGLVFPSEDIGNSKDKDVWWLRYKSCWSSYIPDMQNNVFVYCPQNNEYDYGKLVHLAAPIYKENCNTIIIIRESFGDIYKDHFCIVNKLREMNMDTYNVVLLDKQALRDILIFSGKKNECFDSIISSQICH